jgi:hypothetical protein
LVLLGLLGAVLLMTRDRGDRDQHAPGIHPDLSRNQHALNFADYVRRGRRAPTAIHEQIIQHAQLGTLMWAQSCSARLEDGLCLDDPPHDTTPAPTKLPTRCGPVGVHPVSVGARDPALADKAIEELRAAVALFEHVDGATAADDGAARHAYVLAKLALADGALERSFAAGDQGEPVAQAGARTQYEEIAALGDQIGQMAAASRVGQLERHAMDSLLSAPIPAHTSADDDPEAAIDAHCDSVVEIVEGHERRALERFRSCVEIAAEASASGPSLDELREIVARSRPCARELARLSPVEFAEVAEWMHFPEGEAWERVRHHLELRNFEYAIPLLDAVPVTPGDAYDRENATAIAMRGQRQFLAAELGYRRAIALDGSRPDAFYNLGVLFADFRAADADVDNARQLYREALAEFEQAAARAAGEERTDAGTRIEHIQRVIAQLEALPDP